VALSCGNVEVARLAGQQAGASGCAALARRIDPEEINSAVRVAETVSGSRLMPDSRWDRNVKC
jgi:hypothetical protein